MSWQPSNKSFVKASINAFSRHGLFVTSRPRKMHDPEWLRGHGYDGLWWRGGGETCGCRLDDLAPCGEAGHDCKPGHVGEDGLMHQGKKVKG